MPEIGGSRSLTEFQQPSLNIIKGYIVMKVITVVFMVKCYGIVVVYLLSMYLLIVVMSEWLMMYRDGRRICNDTLSCGLLSMSLLRDWVV